MSNLDVLSPREFQVVNGICEGKTYKSIGRAMGITTSTTTNTAMRAYKKLGVYNREALIRLVAGERLLVSVSSLRRWHIELSGQPQVQQEIGDLLSKVPA